MTSVVAATLVMNYTRPTSLCDSSTILFTSSSWHNAGLQPDIAQLKSYINASDDLPTNFVT